MAQKLNVQKAKQAGFTDQEIEQFVRDNNIGITGTTVGGFLGNVAKSAGRAVRDTGKAILSPIETLKNVKEAGLGGIAGHYGQRYGVTSALKGDFGQAGRDLATTAYFDPAGVALDASGVAGGAGAGLRGGAAIGARAGANTGRMAQFGRGATRLADAVDPTMIAARGARRVGNAGMNTLDNVGSGLIRRGSKATPSQMESFAQASSGVPFEDFLYQNRITGGASPSGVGQINQRMSPFQSQYDAMTKTAQPVSRQQYAMSLLDQADQLERVGTPQARRIAKNLLEEAEFQYTNPRPMTAEELTRMKTTAFSESSKAAISDPYRSSQSEQIGRAGVSTLEGFAPGSQALGKQLRPFHEASGILAKQAERGRGSQLLNAFKAPSQGAIAGGVAGTAIPGVGTITGAAVGTGMAMIGNNPRVLSRAGTTARDIAGLRSSRAAGVAKQGAKGAMGAGRYGAITNRSQDRLQNQSQQLEQSPKVSPSSNSNIRVFSDPERRRIKL